MQNKSKSWSDIQLIISSISVALTLGFWGLFSSNQKNIAGVTDETNFPNQPAPTASVTTNNDILLPGQVLLLNGGSLAQQSATSTPQTTQAPTVQRKQGGGKSGGSVTTTSSSHP